MVYGIVAAQHLWTHALCAISDRPLRLPMTRIYKILPGDVWLAAQKAGVFTGAGIDHRDGYIHFSTAAQAQETARLHFRGQADLVVLEIDAEALATALTWEPSRGGVLFPHLYSSLATDHVVAVHPAPLDADGVPSLAFLDT
jgi:uncharacterized protein (DUF952 family)